MKISYWNSKIISLTDEEFEELCYDLVKSLNFVNVKWVGRGGSDKGRDITAEKIETKAGVTTIKEIWFFQCKKYSNGIPESKISSAIDWAHAEKSDYLVFISNSHLTTHTQEYIKKRQEQISCKIFEWTDKQFFDLLFRFPHLVKAYFPDEKLPKLEKNNIPNSIFEIILNVPQDLKSELEQKFFEIKDLENNVKMKKLFEIIKVKILDSQNFDLNVKALILQNFSVISYRLGNTEDAIKFIEEALKITPKNIVVMFDKAVYLTSMKRYEESLEIYDKILELDPSNKIALNDKGYAFAQLKRYIGAIHCFDKAVAIDPTFIIARDNKGVTLVQQDKHLEAMRIYDDTLAHFPNSKTTLNKKGNLLLEQKNFKVAYDCFERALQIDSTFLDALNNLGVVIQNMDNYVKNEEEYNGWNLLALKKFENILSLDENYSRAYTNRIACLLNLNKIEDASKIIEETLAIFPVNFLVFGEKARLFGMLGKYNEALGFVKKALNLEPKSKELLLTKCWLLIKQGKEKKSLKLVDEIINIFPKSFEAWRLKGDALKLLGKLEKSKKCYAKAQELITPKSLLNLSELLS